MVSENVFEVNGGTKIMANNKIKFVLNGCDIFFIVEAPKDITLEQLLKQCDKIKPHWCACGICTLDYKGFSKDTEPDVSIEYDSIEKVDKNAAFDLKEIVVL